MGYPQMFYIEEANKKFLEGIEEKSKFINRLITSAREEEKLKGLSLEKLKELKKLAELQQEIDFKEREILGYG